MLFRVVLLISLSSMLIINSKAQPTSSPSPTNAQNSSVVMDADQRVRRGTDQANPIATDDQAQGSSTNAPSGAVEAQPSDAVSNSAPIKRSVGQEKVQAVACPCG
ncbi:hypothetical protein QAD02_010675 [Eretmocerus hayati]|uniref:Uncharacterized protein n=1 Tax=Eretmocerus hayati TaxID=131215 RepID=A0ACC2NUI7_9HYME|nr:hypothetical protein QAD02_010675 [Eretmocerus hayati]